MSNSRNATSGKSIQMVSLESLRLDSENPRLPEAHRNDIQTELALLLEMGYDAFAVAQSIMDNGYFMAEPLIVIPSQSEPEAMIVVEGNRRLTALMGLAYPEVRSEFAEPDRWSRVAENSDITKETLIPVVVHSTREETHPEVARAHVVGKLAWHPYAQARYIAARVAEGRSIGEVAEMIGITKSKAADLYRDQAVVRQAQRLGLETSQIEGAFSVLTVAMGNTKLRSHVGVPLGSRLQVDEDPVPEDKTTELTEVISWIFGDEENEAKISDSRQMSQLGNVVASEIGLGALRSGASLDQAKQQMTDAGMNTRDALIKKLTAAGNALSSASDDLGEYATDSEIRELVDDVEALVESLRNVVNETSAEDNGVQ